MSSGARWIAEERRGLHDLGERNQSSDPDPLLAERGGDPQSTAPHRYPLLWRLNFDSFAALEEVDGTVPLKASDHFRQWLYGHGYLDAERAATNGGIE